MLLDHGMVQLVMTESREARPLEINSHRNLLMTMLSKGFRLAEQVLHPT